MKFDWLKLILICYIFPSIQTDKTEKTQFYDKWIEYPKPRGKNYDIRLTEFLQKEIKTATQFELFLLEIVEMRDVPALKLVIYNEYAKCQFEVSERVIQDVAPCAHRTLILVNWIIN
ncbi:hypothetical protein ROZALSC1DRAFT_23541, partial [Rozella allomycis CSF55]